MAKRSSPKVFPVPSMPLQWRSSKFFIPAYNSRHRTACFALYRALLALSPKVPLPSDLAIAWGTKSHPIVHLIRRSFRRNLNDTSPRLVYPALKAGYRMLETLQRAADPKSPEHASILSFLQARLAERQHTLQMKELHPPNSRNPKQLTTAPHPLSLPLLVSTTSPPVWPSKYSLPTYAPAYRPRPLTELPPGKKRKIPKLDLAGDFPLLRVKKPQPPILARILTQKIRKRAARQTLELAMEEEQVEDRREEDLWEHRVMDLLDTEVISKCLREKKADARLPGALQELQDYLWTEHEGQSYERIIKKHGISYLRQVLVDEREDAIARADAMRMIIAEETALAEKEEEERKLDRRRKWEVRMQEEHGEGWKHVIEEENRIRAQTRVPLVTKPAKDMGVESLQKEN